MNWVEQLLGDREELLEALSLMLDHFADGDSCDACASARSLLARLSSPEAPAATGGTSRVGKGQRCRDCGADVDALHVKCPGCGSSNLGRYAAATGGREGEGG